MQELKMENVLLRRNIRLAQEEINSIDPDFKVTLTMQQISRNGRSNNVFDVEIEIPSSKTRVDTVTSITEIKTNYVVRIENDVEFEKFIRNNKKPLKTRVVENNYQIKIRCGEEEVTEFNWILSKINKIQNLYLEKIKDKEKIEALKNDFMQTVISRQRASKESVLKEVDVKIDSSSRYPVRNKMTKPGSPGFRPMTRTNNRDRANKLFKPTTSKKEVVEQVPVVEVDDISGLF